MKYDQHRCAWRRPVNVLYRIEVAKKSRLSEMQRKKEKDILQLRSRSIKKSR